MAMEGRENEWKGSPFTAAGNGTGMKAKQETANCPTQETVICGCVLWPPLFRQSDRRVL